MTSQSLVSSTEDAGDQTGLSDATLPGFSARGGRENPDEAQAEERSPAKATSPIIVSPVVVDIATALERRPIPD